MFVFFFQAEDGIRDYKVTGVQTCALPISQHSDSRVLEQLIYKWSHSREIIGECLTESYSRSLSAGARLDRTQIERDVERSEERRVGKEGRWRGWREQVQKTREVER